MNKNIRKNYQKILDKTLAEITAMQKRPRFLLHSCCAPCSTYVIEYLIKYFDIDILYYNPNIYPQEEYIKRKNEQIKLINEINVNGVRYQIPDTSKNVGAVPCASPLLASASLPYTSKNVGAVPACRFTDSNNCHCEERSNLVFENKIQIIDTEYDHEKFNQIALGHEKELEGSVRCTECFKLRLRKTAKIAIEREYDYFGTTLTVSPHKNAEKINEIGERIVGAMSECLPTKLKWLYSDFKKNEGYKKSIELSKEYGLYRQDYCGCEYSKRL